MEREGAPEFCVALTTTHSAKEATVIAKALVHEGFVAGVNIVKASESVYFWRGKQRQEKEWLLVCRMRADRIPALKARLPELHSYECPELIVLPITDGLPDYLEWLRTT